MDTDPVLGIFVKWPEPGRVKTRLGAAKSQLWAAEVARAFLLDTLDRLAPLSARKLLVFAPPVRRHEFAVLAAGQYGLLSQSDGDLGQRLFSFFEMHSPGPTVAIGSDSPTLPIAIIMEAFERLVTSDVVLGPAADGGYYLLGCKGPTPPVFEGVPWGGPAVLGETVSRLRAGGLRLALLPPWFDVDTPADWEMLAGFVAAQRLAGLDPGVPRTEALLAGQSV